MKDYNLTLRNRPIYMKITHEHPFDHRTDVDIKEIQRD
jgi:hypothetical protein